MHDNSPSRLQIRERLQLRCIHSDGEAPQYTRVWGERVERLRTECGVLDSVEKDCQIVFQKLIYNWLADEDRPYLFSESEIHRFDIQEKVDRLEDEPES